MKRIVIALNCLLLTWVFSGCATTQNALFSMGLGLERYHCGVTHKTVQVGEDTMAYLERYGEGETIVLLHGFTSDKDVWIRFIGHMPEAYRILALDMPGHGDNPVHMDRTYTAEYFTEGVARTIDALELGRVHLAGNSLGGLVATLYALHHPERVITLGLFDSAGVISPEPSELQRMLDKGDNPFDVNSRADFDRLMDLSFYKKPNLPWPSLSVFSRTYIERNEFYQKMWRDLNAERGDKDLRDSLPELNMPTFVLWGDKDHILDVSCVEVYKRYLPDSHVVIMKDCGHAPMMERPREAADHYKRFLHEVLEIQE